MVQSRYPCICQNGLSRIWPLICSTEDNQKNLIWLTTSVTQGISNNPRTIHELHKQENTLLNG